MPSEATTIPKASQETIKTIHNISHNLGLKFNREQIQALIRVCELGADPDATLKFLVDNAYNGEFKQQCTPSTSTSSLCTFRSNLSDSDAETPIRLRR